MKRTVIKIDEAACNGCADCISGCHEGALQLIDGKAVMISDLYCDGLGACIGECPVGAITFQEREAEPYDEAAVMERLIPKGEAAIVAHLKHLRDHNEHEWVEQGIVYLREHGTTIDTDKILTAMNDEHDHSQTTSPDQKSLACGCPGTMGREIKQPRPTFIVIPAGQNSPAPAHPLSELRQFPVQLHLINPEAGFFRGMDLLLAADCTAFASGEFHSRFLRNKSLTIACPKLDSNTEVYIQKLTRLIDQANINTLSVLVMEVPCCKGLVSIARQALAAAERKIPLKAITLSVEGEVIGEEWV